MNIFTFEKIEDTDKLFKYRRLMIGVVNIWLFTLIVMISGLALGLAFGFHTIDLIVSLVCCAVSFALFIPFAFFIAWIGEIEKILTRRCVKIACPIDERIRKGVLKMMFWAVLVVLLPMLIRTLIRGLG